MYQHARIAMFIAGVVLGFSSSAAQMNGQLPMYPNGHNMNSEVPAPPAGMAIPMVLETDDSVPTVDAWYASHTPKSCVRTAASEGIKYACSSGSIMIYKQARTQIAFVPAMPSFMGR
jgi:hypothetical protein